MPHSTDNFFYRTLVKKTKPSSRRNAAERGAIMRKDMTGYVDEIGKSLAQARQTFLQRPRDAEGRVYNSANDIIPSGKGGLCAFGFLLDTGLDPYPKNLLEKPKTGHNLTKNWTNTISRRWNNLLEHPRYKKRRIDRYNAVMSLTIGEEQVLAKHGWNTDTFMREVNQRMMEIYMEGRGWKNDRIGGYGGTHYDKAHSHLHLRIFPVSENGKLISFSNKQQSDKEEDQNLTRWTYASNKATEEWWRKNLPDNEQRPDVQLARIYKKPDPDFIPFSFYLSHNPRLKHWDPQEAIDRQEAMAHAAETLAVLKKNKQMPELEEYPLSKKPGVVLRTLAALKAYHAPINHDGLAGSPHECDIQSRGRTFIELWKKCTSPHPEENTIGLLVQWARERSLAWRETNKTKKDDEKTRRNLRKAQELQRLGSRRIGQLMRQALGLVEKNIEIPSAKEEIRDLLNSGVSPNDATNRIPGEKGFHLRTLVDNLPDFERERIQKDKPPGSGRPLLITLAQLTDEAFTRQKNQSLPDPQLMIYGSRCETATAQALVREEKETPPAHLQNGPLTRIENMIPQKEKTEQDPERSFQQLELQPAAAAEYRQILEEPENPEEKTQSLIKQSNARIQAVKKENKIGDI